MILSVTGHRPDKIGGYVLPNETYGKVMAITSTYLWNLKPTHVLTGMALGFDQMVAQLCLNVHIPYIACIPFEGQEGMWSDDIKKYYNFLLDNAFDVINVSGSKTYKSYFMQKRNEYMVDHSDRLLACFDGSEGGTKNCIDYARKVAKPIEIIDPKVL